jgi:uncharacterized phage protein gp47/JayE
VHVTIAGQDETAITAGSGAVSTLGTALIAAGDPHLPVAVAACRLKLVVIAARVRLVAGFAWDDVQPRIRAAALDALGFARRDLGQPMLRSEVIALIQAVPGVSYVVLDALSALPADFDAAALEAIAAGAGVHDVPAAGPRLDRAAHQILPAEVAFLTSAVPAVLLLAEITA